MQMLVSFDPYDHEIVMLRFSFDVEAVTTDLVSPSA